MWCVGGSSNVELTIFLLIDLSMLVISSGCSSMSRTISEIFGWFWVIVLVIFWRSIVLFVNGGATIIPCCFFLIGVIRFMIRVDSLFLSCLRLMWFVGWSGVRLSKMIFCLVCFGFVKLIVSI